jgi:hypothetical protein
MKSINSNGSSKVDQSLEKDVGGNIRALTRASGGVHHSEAGNGEISGENLGTLLRQVSEVSTREIQSLIDELHGLRQKLESRGEHIQSDITSYAELSQGVMQLTTIISENVKKLPTSAPDVSR